MAIQPDFILQYANYLEKTFQEKFSMKDPIVRVNSHVSLNGRSSQVFIDPTQDLTEVGNVEKINLQFFDRIACRKEI